jgi:hypothetical protein
MNLRAMSGELNIKRTRLAKLCAVTDITELSVGLDRHEAHVLSQHGLGDRFGIQEVVLV